MRMKTAVVQIPIDPELEALINDAVDQTGLSKGEVIRQGLRKGVSRVARPLGHHPKRTLLDALRQLKGLEIPERKYPMKRRCGV